eukprot:TRINITY_DN16216_c0_g1_i2.p1 TRINITY_DN16216_c0_g1~~TRINITY_DN16216_c0_g1_i2.p1  ORF type:complete len:669 (-),score=88.72 TRINITY_DN16216_c0_g1_i2:37-1971(-)
MHKLSGENKHEVKRQFTPLSYRLQEQQNALEDLSQMSSRDLISEAGGEESFVTAPPRVMPARSVSSSIPLPRQNDISRRTGVPPPQTCSTPVTIWNGNRQTPATPDGPAAVQVAQPLSRQGSMQRMSAEDLKMHQEALGGVWTPGANGASRSESPGNPRPAVALVGVAGGCSGRVVLRVRPPPSSASEDLQFQPGRQQSGTCQGSSASVPPQQVRTLVVPPAGSRVAGLSPRQKEGSPGIAPAPLGSGNRLPVHERVTPTPPGAPKSNSRAALRTSSPSVPSTTSDRGGPPCLSQDDSTQTTPQTAAPLIGTVADVAVIAESCGGGSTSSSAAQGWMQTPSKQPVSACSTCSPEYQRLVQQRQSSAQLQQSLSQLPGVERTPSLTQLSTPQRYVSYASSKGTASPPRQRSAAGGQLTPRGSCTQHTPVRVSLVGQTTPRASVVQVASSPTQVRTSGYPVAVQTPSRMSAIHASVLPLGVPAVVAASAVPGESFPGHQTPRQSLSFTPSQPQLPTLESQASLTQQVLERQASVGQLGQGSQQRQRRESTRQQLQQQIDQLQKMQEFLQAQQEQLVLEAERERQQAPVPDEEQLRAQTRQQPRLQNGRAEVGGSWTPRQRGGVDSSSDLKTPRTSRASSARRRFLV